jgi:hypothetical protein
VLMGVAPVQGGRHVQVTNRRTAQDVAHGLKDLVAIHFPEAAVVSVVLDTRHTHTPAALSAPVPPAEACRLRRQVDFHETPTHGRGLNRAEIDFAVVSTPGWDRRLADAETVRRTIAAWATRRQAAQAIVAWRVTTAQARRTRTHIDPL